MTANAQLNLIVSSQPRHTRPARRALGNILVEDGALAPGDLLRALAIQQRQDLRLGDILLAHGMVSEAQLVSALARQHNAFPVDLDLVPPDPRLIDEMGIERCLETASLPLRRLGGATIIATARPDAFAALCRELPASFGEPVLALCQERALHRAIIALRSQRLVRKAETRVPDAQASRYWYGGGPRRVILTGFTVLLVALALAPIGTLAALTLWAMICMTAGSALKLAGAAATWDALRRRRDAGPPAQRPLIARLPEVSVMVPLFREEDVVPRLIARLERLDYPRELLDICLVTEEDDTTTRDMLARATLPFWMRVITVPNGSLKTKPRALNFALDFCRGSIIGVWDAEDAPDPDQIHRIVRRFHERGADVACLQGVLDFYNTGRNWLSRAFTIEYSGWFRVVLPGIARMGLVVPLGGTTFFIRRAALVEMGGWDAHNVTEDADLGVRLARHGYRTELIDTVTNEEANCRTWPWIKQRSRWLKGFAMTWASHMRQPRQLWRDIGPWKFLGLQITLLGAASQALLVPLVWSFWALALGLPHPLTDMLGGPVIHAMAVLFLVAEAITMGVGAAGAARAGKTALWGWVPTMHLYYPLAAFAMYKAMYELVARPFYWDKTQHAVAGDCEETDLLPPP